MGIRRRISDHVETTPVEDEIENVYNPRADDERGVFDPSQDPFPGSYMEVLCGPDATMDERRIIIGAISHDVSSRGQQRDPREMRAQDVLANLRTMDNPGEGVEQTYRNRIRSPLTGIRAFCVHDCKSGSPKAVGLCRNMVCPLWPFRMGRHGMR